MSKSAHALVFCRLFSDTISLVSLGEAILSLSISMGSSLHCVHFMESTITPSFYFTMELSGFLACYLIRLFYTLFQNVNLLLARTCKLYEALPSKYLLTKFNSASFQ